MTPVSADGRIAAWYRSSQGPSALVSFVAVGPGYAATDLNAGSGHLTPGQAAANVVAVITRGHVDSPEYVSAEGAPGW